MNEKDYLEVIFERYVQTKELLDLKEEIYSNLHESILKNMREGMSKERAFEKSREELGDLTQILRDYPLKDNKIEKILYYASVCSIIFGIFAAIVSISDNGREYNRCSSFNLFLPFCVGQTAYILWYKIGHAKKTKWNILFGLCSGFFLFNLFMGVSGCIDYWHRTNGNPYFALGFLGMMGTIFTFINVRKESIK